MKKKTYVLMLAKKFPAYHSKAGLSTNFFQAIQNKEKIHTIRNNYDLWAKRASEINSGKAVLSIREWTGKPYKSPQKELMELSIIGLQKVELCHLGYFIDDKESDVCRFDLALNDGLSSHDFKEWFKGGMKLNQVWAIIHFSTFRYS